MNFQQLVSSDMKSNLVTEIQGMNLSGCSNDELMSLDSWLSELKKQADFSTLEDEVVGYTYDSLHALAPKLTLETSKRGMCLVKVRNFNK